MNLVALKRLRYPRGPDGVEYNAGDSFTALSERDAKALTLVRAASNAPAEVKVVKPAPVKPAEVSTAAMAPAEKAEETPKRRYTRRDMRASED